MTPKQQKALVSKIIKKHGATLDLEANPEVMIEILRSFGRSFDEPDGGLPGGVGPVGCIVDRDGINQIALEDVMKAILKLTRDVANLKTAVGAKGK
jgi:hypothetical protein